MRISESNEWWLQLWRATTRALREVGVTALISLTPVWAGAAISLLIQELTTFWDALAINTARGDLFLLATSAVAPLTLYITVKRSSLPKPLTIHFPGGTGFMCALILLFGACTVMFSLKRASELPGSTLKINNDLFFWGSITFYVASVILSIIVTIINFYIEDMRGQNFRTDTNSFVDNFRKYEVKSIDEL